MNPFSAFVKSHVFWTIPEQLFEPVLPGQPPLSRWIADMLRTVMPVDWGECGQLQGVCNGVDSVFLG